MDKIIIIGGRGTAIVIADQIYDAHRRFQLPVEVLGLALDDTSNGHSINDYPILCKINELLSKYEDYNDVFFIYSLYRPDVMEERTKILHDLKIPLKKMYNFIHPTVMFSKSSEIGFGNVILANTVVNCNFRMGNFNTVNSNSLLGHDTSIGDNNYLAGHVCVGSGIKMGSKNFIGLNTSLRNGITIGNTNIVGMSSNVTKDVSDNNVLYGNPALVKPRLNHVIR